MTRRIQSFVTYQTNACVALDACTFDSQEEK
jgi:hypothetical protein